MKNLLFLSALLGAVMAYGTGCGDGSSGSGGSGGTGAATNTGGGGGTGGTNTGGTGGTGGTNTGGTGGTGGTTTMTGNLVNGCDPATAEDKTAMEIATVNQQGFKYAPPCIKIKAGASVTFMSNFTMHPLVGGEIEGGAKVPDAASPIKATGSGTTATFAFPTAGTYGYYCDVHGLGGMMGAIFVE